MDAMVQIFRTKISAPYIALGHDPDEAHHAATKAYVDRHAGGGGGDYLPIGGGTLTGVLQLPASGFGDQASLTFGSNLTGFGLRVIGDTIFLMIGGRLVATWSAVGFQLGGPLNMSTAQINYLGDPVEPQDAANRAYVDRSIAALPPPPVIDLSPYLLLDGSRPMTGLLRFANYLTGLLWSSGALIYDTSSAPGNALVFRRPPGNPEFLVEDNSGSLASRTPIITQAAADGRYIKLSGETCEWLAANLYLLAPWGAQNRPGLMLGDNTTGFWRNAGDIAFSFDGGANTPIGWNRTTVNLQATLAMNGRLITGVAPPVAASDAVPRSYVDARAGRAIRVYVATEVVISLVDAVCLDVPFAVLDSQPRTIVVTLTPTFRGGVNGVPYQLIYTATIGAGAALVHQQRVTAYTFSAGADAADPIFLQSPVRFGHTVTPVANVVQVRVTVRFHSSPGAGGGAFTQTGEQLIAGEPTIARRTLVTIEEMSD
jgi:hypothetical protein